MSAVMKYSFLGPLGTFCHQALTQRAPENAELFPCAGERLAMDMVREGRADRAVVPIENSVEGGVNATLDSLGWGKRLQIIGEMIVPVGFTLASREPIKLPEQADQIKRIGTHSHAWAQCRNWMADHLPNTIHVATASTAEAAKRLATDPNCGFDAILSSQIAVEMYGLHQIYQDVADNRGAVTRFVELALPGHVPEPCGADKTTIQVQLPYERAGALLEMLQQFAAHAVNLTRIESRPIAGHPGNYAFSLDIAGHLREERVRAALEGVYRTCRDLRFLGSYPRADHNLTIPAENTSDQDFQQARFWVDQILSK